MVIHATGVARRRLPRKVDAEAYGSTRAGHDVKAAMKQVDATQEAGLF